MPPKVPTQRDKVWYTALQLSEWQRSFTVADVQEAIGDDTPSERTVRNALNAMETLGVLASEGGAGRSSKSFFPQITEPPATIGGYSPRPTNHSNTFPYPGGKGRLSEWIIDKMPVHDTYVEVFGGSAGILFNKPRSKYEIYNDQNDDLTNFFAVLRDRPEELAEWLHAVPYSRTQYETWVTEFYDGYRPQDPIERAGRFFSLRYMQFAGDTSSANGFKVRAKRSPARTFDNARKRIDVLARRFEQVTIENQDYRHICSRYDDSDVDVLFYADPPYIGSEGYYGDGFDHEAFVDVLHAIENDWMVSYAELPDGLDDYTVLERTRNHRMKRNANSVCEKLVCNFDPSERPLFSTNE